MKSFPMIVVLASPLCPAGADDAAVAATPIESIVADVVAHHPELRFYEEEIAAARAVRASAGSWDQPELDFGVGRKRVSGSAGDIASAGTAWAVSITQVFEWPGRVPLRKAIADCDLELAENGLMQFRAALEVRARTLALGLGVSERKAQAAAEVAERFAALKETLSQRDPAGLTPMLEVRAIEAEELVLQRRTTEAELEIVASLSELNLLRGCPEAEPLTVAPPEVQFSDLPSADGILAAARGNNFGHRARLLEVERQRSLARLARHERLPAISVSPFFEQESAAERETVAGVGFSLPLPVGGRAAAQVELAEARHRQAEAAVAAAERELRIAVVTAAQRYAAKLAEMRRWEPESVERFREAAALADRHYRLGAVHLPTYIEMQRAYLDAVETLLETRREALESGLELALLTGGVVSVVRVAK